MRSDSAPPAADSCAQTPLLREPLMSTCVQTPLLRQPSLSTADHIAAKTLVVDGGAAAHKRFCCETKIGTWQMAITSAYIPSHFQHDRDEHRRANARSPRLDYDMVRCPHPHFVAAIALLGFVRSYANRARWYLCTEEGILFATIHCQIPFCSNVCGRSSASALSTEVVCHRQSTITLLRRA